MPETWWGEPLYKTLSWDESTFRANHRAGFLINDPGSFRRYCMNETIQADDPAADRWARDGHRADHTQTLAPIEPDAVWVPDDNWRGGIIWFDALTGQTSNQPPGGA